MRFFKKVLRAKVSMKNFINGGVSYDYGTIFKYQFKIKYILNKELYDFLNNSG